MPCCARESTSLIILLLAAVRSSSSFKRSRMGCVWRWTYFLRANGFTRPQNPSRAGGCNGFPVALSVGVLVLVCDEVCAGWLAVVWSCELELELVCAKAGKANRATTTKATSAFFFICVIPPPGKRLSSPLRAPTWRLNFPTKSWAIARVPGTNEHQL